jgi:excisionase family DNA binding protein
VSEEQSERLLLRPREAAQALGLSTSNVFALVRRGELPSLRIGRALRIPRAALEDWVSQRTIGSR